MKIRRNFVFAKKYSTVYYQSDMYFIYHLYLVLRNAIARSRKRLLRQVTMHHCELQSNIKTIFGVQKQKRATQRFDIMHIVNTYIGRKCFISCQMLYDGLMNFRQHGHLGKGKREVCPSCVVRKICAKFPSADGRYTGFKRAE